MGKGPAADRGGEPDPGRRGAALGWIVVALCALLPSWGTLAAPWISDDAVILGYVHREGAGDWFGSQYDLITIHFWRPLVTTSWAVQEWLFGVDPAPFRALNLLCHVITALIVTGVARTLGIRGPGAFLAGALVGLFPDQGGTVTWVAGRVDSLTEPFFVGALLLAQTRRFAPAVLVAFLACACKESSFVLPGWALALALGAGRTPRESVAPFLAVLAGTLTAFLWRRFALGAWIGGYPAADVGLVTSLVQAARALAPVLGPTLIGLVLLAAFGLLGGTLRWLPFGAGLACAAGGAAPLFALLTDGLVEAQNRRTLCFADIGLCLAAGAALAAWPANKRTPWHAAAVAVGLLLVVGRGVYAWRDTHEWAAAGEVAEAAIQRARAEAEVAGPGELPLLYAGFPEVHGGAYCLSYGAADRLRAPFPKSPRPVWPLRSMFGYPENERAPRAPVTGGWSRPFDPPANTVDLDVRAEGGGPLTSLEVDERVPFADLDQSDAFELTVPSGAQLEVVLYTEMGYEPFVLGEGDVVSLMRLFGTTNGRVSCGEAWVFSASLGARTAYVEARLHDAEGGVAFSPWIPLVWDPAVLALAPR